MYDDLLKVLFSREQISGRVKQIAEEINRDYKDRAGRYSLLCGSVPEIT